MSIGLAGEIFKIIFQLILALDLGMYSTICSVIPFFYYVMNLYFYCK